MTSAAHLQVTGEECGSFSFRQPSDLLEGEKVVHVDVVLCRRNAFSQRFMSWLTKGLQMTKLISSYDTNNMPEYFKSKTYPGD